MVPVAPLRIEAAHSSEMVSQILFGELAELLETGKSFLKVKCLYDGYEGWCQKGQMIQIEESQAELITEKLNAGWTDAIELNNTPMHLSLGSSLGILNNGKAQISKFEITCERTLWDPKQHQPNGELILQTAKKYLNTPYLWGGRSVFGIDCSGFVQQVFRFFGIKLPRDAYQQAMEGELIGFLQEAKCGDLAYFDNIEGKIVHVGILIDSESIIHASGKVRIDKIDNLGIVNTDTGERSHQLRIIKRYFA
jgi:hypothetical protein